MAHKTPSMRFTWLTLALLSAPVPAITNQSAPGATQPPPQFEVASIKPNKSGDGRVMLSVQPGGRFTATNVTLRMMIRNAYQLQEFQITGGPSWISQDRFDIVAKAESRRHDGRSVPSGAERSAEPRPADDWVLLAERFKLVVHNEDKEMPIYALVLARSDGRLGPQLKQSEVDCAAQMAAGRGAAAVRCRRLPGRRRSGGHSHSVRHPDWTGEHGGWGFAADAGCTTRSRISSLAAS